MSAAKENVTPKRKKRVNGQGSVFFDARRKVFIARYSYRDPDGHLKQKSFSGNTEEAALARMMAAKYKAKVEDSLTNEEPGSKVYFIQAMTGGPIKIGRTNDIHRRLADIQACSPIPLRVVHIITNAGDTVENRLHRQFARHRLHGEWFDNVAELVGYIHDLKTKRSRR